MPIKLDFNKFDFVVINTCYGGFGISKEAALDIGYLKVDLSNDSLRTNQKLIKLLLQKGSSYCSDSFSHLELVKIDKKINWEISEYDGLEEIVVYPKVEHIEIPQ